MYPVCPVSATESVDDTMLNVYVGVPMFAAMFAVHLVINATPAAKPAEPASSTSTELAAEYPSIGTEAGFGAERHVQPVLAAAQIAPLAVIVTFPPFGTATVGVNEKDRSGDVRPVIIMLLDAAPHATDEPAMV